MKPGSVAWDYPDMIKESGKIVLKKFYYKKSPLVTEALNDCGLKYADIQQATVSYIYGGTCCGQRGLYELGFTGILIYNVIFLAFE